MRFSVRCGAALLLIFCLVATTRAILPPLPADLTINKDAGRGNFLFVTLRLMSGKELPFIVDTGMPDTCLDKSLESKLGKRLGTEMYYTPGEKQKSGVYQAPALYLGNIPLMTESNINTLDLKWLSAEARRPVMGIVGMDCLKHYCIQLDFSAGEMRFLDPGRLKVATLGKALPMTFDWEGCPKIHQAAFLQETNSALLIDTGANIDGSWNKKLFRQEVRQHKLYHEGGIAIIPNCNWDGGFYTNLAVANIGNSIGLRFLARHTVTLDFPNQVMYLIQTSVGPLVSKDTEADGRK